MKALLSTQIGGPETLVLSDIPDPEPKAGEILIAVKAAGVNFPDSLIVRDLYQFRPPRPFSPGAEVAGTVVSVGNDITGFAAGDRVLATGLFGGFATRFVADAARTFKIPDTMPFDEAAAFVFTYGTSYYGLADRAALKSGETLLVLGAAGGIGASAIELGKASGARVIAAVSSEDKAEFCRSIGADDAVIYPRDMDRTAQKSFADDIKQVAGNAGVDVVLDAVGGDYAEPALRRLNWEGRYLVVGFPAGIPAIPLNLPLLKSCQIIGVFWGAFLARKPARYAEHMAEIFALYEAGKIKPQITARYPLADAAKAISAIETRKAQGKMVITMD